MGRILGTTWSAAHLFILMTVDIWLTVAASKLLIVAPHPKTLQEAMETWTVVALERAFPNINFIASNSDLTGEDKKDAAAVCRHGSHLLPLQGTFLNGKSVWNTLAKKGYIKEYHSRIAPLSNASQEALHQALRVILPQPPMSSSRDAMRWPKLREDLDV